MKQVMVASFFALSLLGLAASAQAATVLVAFHTMHGVDDPFVGANPIRDIPGDEAPWEVARFIHGTLDTDGRLVIIVRGLVFSNDPRVQPPSLIGKNDEATFRAVVSCLTADGSGGVITTNVTTDGFPASMDGDANIHTTIQLPTPCVAPLVFVIAGSEFKWFAVTGSD
jgi:hypothetical protein